MEVTGAISVWTVLGIRSSAIARRSATSCLARYMSVPQENSTHIMERLSELLLRTRRTPGSPFTALSMGNVTYCSTSPAEKPPASLIMSTVGAFNSGKMSTGISESLYPAAKSIRPAMISTTVEFLMEKAIRRWSILVFLSGYGRNGGRPLASGRRRQASVRKHRQVQPHPLPLSHCKPPSICRHSGRDRPGRERPRPDCAGFA